MTIPTPELSTMKQDISGLIVDWGVACSIRRQGTTLNTAGQISAARTSVATETLWIQPVDSRAFRLGAVIEPGLKDEMYFEYWEHFSGYAMQAGDQILESGGVYVYDVLAVQILQTHRHGFIKQVKRS